MSDQYEDLVVTEHVAGSSKTLTVDHWPKRTRFTVEFLDGADPRFVTYADDRVTIKTARGERTYQLGPVDDRDLDRDWPAVRIGTLLEAGE